MFDLLIIVVFLLNIGFILGAAVVLLMHHPGMEDLPGPREDFPAGLGLERERRAAAGE